MPVCSYPAMRPRIHKAGFSACRFSAVPHGIIQCTGLCVGKATSWIQACRPHVTANELHKAARFMHAEDAVRHMAGRALVRRVLQASAQRALTAEFTLNPYGKPCCQDSDVHFSISHSGGMVWAAFCRDASVGIDVQKKLPLQDLMALVMQLHPQEAMDIRNFSANERAAAFYRCWTRKEAVLKVLGKGLSLPLDSFQVRVDLSCSDWIASLPDEACRATTGAEYREPGFSDGQSGYSCRQAVAVPTGWTSLDVWSSGVYQCGVAAQAPGLELHVSVITKA